MNVTSLQQHLGVRTSELGHVREQRRIVIVPEFCVRGRDGVPLA